MNPLEKLRLSLCAGDSETFRRAMTDIRMESHRRTVDFSCIKSAASMMDEISPELFLELCSYCDPSDKLTCVAYAALHRCFPLLQYFLPLLESDEKAQLWPLFPILINERKYDVVDAFLAEGIFPNRVDFTIWPLLVNSLSLDLFHSILNTNRLNPAYFPSIILYCERLLNDESLSQEKKTFTQTFLNDFQKYCADHTR